MSESKTESALKRTPLHASHLRLGARMVPFAGYDMPVQYPSGIIKEHLQTRAAAGLFDVSHMGQIALRPRSGSVEDAARAFESLVPADVVGLAPGRQRYALFTNTTGGVLDDLMVSNQRDHLLLVVNASRKDADEAHVRNQLSAECHVESLADHALLALQGPRSEEVLAELAPEVRAMRFMDARPMRLMGETVVVSRSGYTGEDGFEISIHARRAEDLWEALLRDSSVMPVGLGARDSLRLEAGLCLYGSDLDEATTPVEAALEWAIPWARRDGGIRAGGFAGAATILGQLASGAPRRRVGLNVEGRMPVRGGALLFGTQDDSTPVGMVSSGGFGPSLNAPVAMGYVPSEAARPGERLFAEVRGKRLPVIVTNLPFVASSHKRP